MSDFKVCKTIDHPNVSGWGCHLCASFNGIINLAGDMRTECKVCGHTRCFEQSEDEDMDAETNFSLN